jgi:hypothetical protein
MAEREMQEKYTTAKVAQVICILDMMLFSIFVSNLSVRLYYSGCRLSKPHDLPA